MWTAENETFILCCIYRVFHVLVDITAGGDFLGLCNQKRSYKHVSDLGRLRSYGHFLIPVHALVWTALWNQLAGDVLNSVAYRLRCKHYFCHLTRPPSCKQSSFLITALGTHLRNGWDGGMGGYSPGQCILLNSATTTCSKTLITYITVTAATWCSEEYGDGFVKLWAVEATVYS